MSAHETTSLPHKPSNTHGMVFYQSAVPEYEQALPLSPAGVPGRVGSAGMGVTGFLHALRRVWLAALLVGLLVGGLAGVGAWFGQSSTYTAVSYIRVAPSEQQLALSQANRFSAESYEAYKGSQQELIKSRFVLMAATRGDVANVPMIRDEPDQVTFLQEKLSVSLPKNTELMLVSLKGESAEDVKKLVQAVVDAYKKEVVDHAQLKRSGQISQLKELQDAKALQVRSLSGQLKTLADNAKVYEPEALKTKQQVILQQYGALRGELTRVQSEMRRVEAEKSGYDVVLRSTEAPKTEAAKTEAAKTEAPKTEAPKTEAPKTEAPKTEGDKPAGGEFQPEAISRAELAPALASDLIYRQMLMEKSRIDLDRLLVDSVAGGAMANRFKRGTDELEQAFKRQLEDRENELRKEMIDGMRARAGIEKRKLESHLETLKAQAKSLGDAVKDAEKAADELVKWSVDVDTYRDDIRQTKEVAESIGRQIEQLNFEQKVAPRIEVIQPAEVPLVPSQAMRIALTIFATFVGLLLPVGLIVAWDASAQRINSSAEVSREVGLDVFGVVPLVPTRVMRHIASPDHHASNWRALICESVDGIAARLLHVAEFERTQVVMVSSAAGGEGKTVLATQLAMSLARTGHKTLLVDFDLRRPAIEKVFKLTLGPGVSEVLRGEAEVQEAIRETETPNLSVMTAGAWNPRLLTILAGEITESLFASLRSQYEFIVVDGCPILPVADARFVSQHADGVILAVLRDVSRAPKIRTACRILSALGVRMLGAVVAESAANGDYSDSRYYRGFRTMVVKASNENQ